MAASRRDRPQPELLEWLRTHGVDYEIHEHAQAFTAERTARAEGIAERTFAKVVGVITDDGRRALLVLDAPDRVDLDKAREVLGASSVRVLSEKELQELAPDCDAGAIPAIGTLFGLPMHVDYAVEDDPEISFNAGTHRHTVRVDRADWERAAGVHYVDLAVAGDRSPAWAR
jgi:Ala-tRNA(Pro) deacylase